MFLSTEVLEYVVAPALTGASIILGYFYRKAVGKNESAVKRENLVRDNGIAENKKAIETLGASFAVVEAEQTNMKENYLDRFREVGAKIDGSEVNVLKAIHTLSDRIEERYTTKEYCHLMHNNMLRELQKEQIAG